MSYIIHSLMLYQPCAAKTYTSSHGRKFVAKCGGQLGGKPIYSSGRCRRDVLYIHFPNIISRGVLKATVITLCFVLADDLHISILEYVAGQLTRYCSSACLHVFGCKQAQQYNRIHQLGVIRAVSWSAQNAESHWSHGFITLTVEHFSFHAFYVWVTARFDVLYSRFNVTKRTNIFLHISVF